MTDDLQNLDFDDDDDVVTEENPNRGDSDNIIDSDNYVKPYLGANGEPEPDLSIGNQELENEDDLITAFLKSKGIKDISSIKMEAEDGSIEEKDFNSLSREEQLNILSSTDAQSNGPNLYDDEIDFLNEVRSNNISVNDYVECLNNNHTQRYYCANKVSNKSYKALDKLVEKYGYTYKQNGYNLFIEKVEK